jgi:pyrimidine 5'-nucleotidase
MFHTLFIDLDNTIYPKSSGLMDAIRDRIISYMGNVMNMTEEEIRMTREYSLKKYGTTLIGLMELYGIDKQHYLDYVHDLALEDFLTRDPELVSILKSLPQRKIIFSNADLGHVYRVLDYLQIREFFCHIIDVHMLMPNVKPQPEAFAKALAATGLSSWEGCAFIDDYLPNVLSAEKLGIFSILVDESGEQNHANCISSIGNLNDFFHANRI